ncbi:MAG: hypothetical protein ABID38_05795 [Candidatus Diapherotrites archaeon]
MAVPFNSSTRGVLQYTLTASNDTTGASDALTDDILFGMLVGVRFLNGTNTANNWDVTLRDADGLQIYTGSSINSADSHANNFVVPSIAGTNSTNTEFTYPVSGQLSVSIANASASSAPQVRFYLRQ